MFIFAAIWAIRTVHGLWIGLALGLPLIRLGMTLCGAKLPFDRSWAGLHAFMMGFALVQYALDWSCPLSRAEQWLQGTPQVSFTAPITGFVSTSVVLGLAFSWLLVGLMGPVLVRHLMDRVSS